MGACFNTVKFDGKLTVDELKSEFSSYKRDREYEQGHDPYNGTLATTQGLRIDQTVFPSESEAYEYISNNTVKWQAALAVRFKVVKVVKLKEPTFGGKKRSDTNSPVRLYDAMCVRHLSMTRSSETNWSGPVLADQLSDAQKERVKKLFDALSAASRNHLTAEDVFRTLVRNLQNIDGDFTPEDFKNLKKIRAELKKAAAALRNSQAKFTELDKKLAAGIYKEENKDDGVQWLVGGWCAE